MACAAAAYAKGSIVSRKITGEGVILLQLPTTFSRESRVEFAMLLTAIHFATRPSLAHSQPPISSLVGTGRSSTYEIRETTLSELRWRSLDGSKTQAVNAMRSYLMHYRFRMGDNENNNAMRWFAYRTLAMRVRGGIILRLNAYGRDKISTTQNGIFCIVKDDQSWNDHSYQTHTQLSVALENYRTWTIPTFTTYLHSCVMHTMAINMSLYDQKSGCRGVTDIIYLVAVRCIGYTH
ncbi:hypothetical protein EDD22DRAFT_284153 [Suillus occidentalis]|nr:hypothetical protein EDD22DRAFT_284153 [Suillus occidentalis]